VAALVRDATHSRPFWQTSGRLCCAPEGLGLPGVVRGAGLGVVVSAAATHDHFSGGSDRGEDGTQEHDFLHDLLFRLRGRNKPAFWRSLLGAAGRGTRMLAPLPKERAVYWVLRRGSLLLGEPRDAFWNEKAVGDPDAIRGEPAALHLKRIEVGQLRCDELSAQRVELEDFDHAALRVQECDV